MSALIIGLPADKRRRPEGMARERKLGVNNFIGEQVTILFADFHAEIRFRIPASRGARRADGGRVLLTKAAGRDSSN
jgi:hypothetical protein